MLQKIKVKKCKSADWSQSLPFSYSPFFEPPWRELVSGKKYVLILAPSLWERYGRRKKLKAKLSFHLCSETYTKCNRFLRFHTSWSPNSEGLLVTLKKRNPAVVQENKNLWPCLYFSAELGHERSWCSPCYRVNHDFCSGGKPFVRTGYGNSSVDLNPF